MDPMIVTPVFFQGNIVGWLPMVNVSSNRIVFRLATAPHDVVDKASEPGTLTVTFTVRDRGVNGKVGELHVDTLIGLLDLPGFCPEDRALPLLTGSRINRA